ncbi:hypothetical protein M427DRAFT_63213 [Gonapodya prolifera JEL478]|uniref:DM13 domain-containing protein n=1 Tax=Gonapodya prolifera (strain JEL478) TaxID=1344416 RepID=A0A139A0V0_GONPJ|nr:hypothetical protein M427DRAFT_63213 [Gonapodya prolifera JEL478]|eukprot:KXS09983.1 hypothetical protein M427DRAFT_63213 [Gonapodya prolifera JEL478]
MHLPIALPALSLLLALLPSSLAQQSPSFSLGRTCPKSHPAVGFSAQFSGSNTAGHVVMGTLTVVDDCTFTVADFSVTPPGPAVVFWAAKGESRADLVAGTPINPTQIVGEVRGVTWMVQLVPSLTWSDVGLVSVWCMDFKADFDHIVIGQGAAIPPPTPSTGTPASPTPASPSPSSTPAVPPPTSPPGSSPSPTAKYDGCATLQQGTYNLYWSVDQPNNLISLGVEIAPPTSVSLQGGSGTSPAFWAAFGVPNTTSVSMVGADVAVVGIDRKGAGYALDYYITERSQCDYQATRSVGVCPDNGGDPAFNDVTYTGVTEQAGVYFFEYTRPIKPVAAKAASDAEIVLNEARPFVWAYGPITEDPTRPVVLYHGPNNHAPPTFSLQFLPASRTCTPLMAMAPANTTGGNTNTTARVVKTLTDADGPVFNVTVGPNANYPNPPAWGISFHINGAESPVLNLTRTTTYTFRIAASSQHPFVLTNSILGGFGESGAANMSATDTVYAGGEAAWGTPGKPFVLTWTPNATTPASLFYQCWVHQKLGWRINLRDAAAGGSAGTNATVGGTGSKGGGAQSTRDGVWGLVVAVATVIAGVTLL